MGYKLGFKMNYYSQYGQDKYLLEEIFPNKNDGYYVDIGAHDGVSLSNTKKFEEIGWNGVCIEPHPKRFQELLQNRGCLCYNIAISDKNELIDFLCVDGYPQMLSGVLENYDQRHLQRIENEIHSYGGSKEIIKVHSRKFSDIIDREDIDYVSIDVEGSELNILRSIDFDRHNIKCFSIENAYGSDKLNMFLVEKGYYIINSMGCDVFFIRE